MRKALKKLAMKGTNFSMIKVAHKKPVVDIILNGLNVASIILNKRVSLNSQCNRASITHFYSQKA